MGGLKSIAAVVLLKIKIVLWLAAIVAVVIFTGKYLLGSADFPGFYKNNFYGQPGPYIPQYPHYTHYNQDYFPPEIVHQSIYDHGNLI